MIYNENIRVSESIAKTIQRYINATEEKDFQGEDDTIIYTATFPNDIEMDVKCCGCNDENSWCEAVLFKKGVEINCSEVEDDFFGEWELEYDGDTYRVDVWAVPEND